MISEEVVEGNLAASQFLMCFVLLYFYDNQRGILQLSSTTVLPPLYMGSFIVISGKPRYLHILWGKKVIL